MQEHNPVPWKLTRQPDGYDGECYQIYDADNQPITTDAYPEHVALCEDNAQHVVRCVNKIAAISKVLDEWEEKSDSTNLKTVCKIAEIVNE